MNSLSGVKPLEDRASTCPRRLLDRRSFGRLLGLASIGLMSRESIASEQHFTQRLGAQLYTVREQLQTEPEGTLRAIAEIGYRQVEVQDGIYPVIASILADLQLEVRGYRLAPAVVTGNWKLWQDVMRRMGSGMAMDLKEQSFEEAIQPAAEKGMQNVVASYLLPPERDSVDKLKRIAERFNQCGEICRGAGLRLCYHNHAFEFGPLEKTTPFEVLNREFDPNLVHWQIDVFWAAVGGKEPASLIRDLGSRTASLHLKDMAEGTPRQFTEQIPSESFVPVGQGTLDFSEILKAAQNSGVAHFFVELDHSPGHPVDGLKSSFEHLRSLEL